MYSKAQITSLNQDIIKHFNHLAVIKADYHMSYKAIARMVMLDRYAQKDQHLTTLKVNDVVICQIKPDPKFPTRAIGTVLLIRHDIVHIKVDSEYVAMISPNLLITDNIDIIAVSKNSIEKPLELFYEQIAYRVAAYLATGEKKETVIFKQFYQELINLNFVPAGRILYGAGSKSQVTYFNCFVLPFIRDSREGISFHRKQTLEIMSRGGGVGTNGSTLRPKGLAAKTVGGKSSGAISWLHDLSSLTHLVEQGGSRRGAQMIMLADWHPDVIEFIISKMTNVSAIQTLIEQTTNPFIKQCLQAKLTFVPFDPELISYYHLIMNNEMLFSNETITHAQKQLSIGGKYIINNKEYMSGANISVAISDDFMTKVANDDIWALQFPDLDGAEAQVKKDYDNFWEDIGDIRIWKDMGYPTKTHLTLPAKELWQLITTCATYSAEPGIFFIDRANALTNATGYEMRVIATNPCGEQPLTPYSVCNLGAINLANFVNKKTGVIEYAKLTNSVDVAVRFLDNVIDHTPYFFSENKYQALGERRIGLGVMGLHDMLIFAGLKYGDKQSLVVIDEIFKTICLAAYRASINLAKEKGSFKFLTNKTKYVKQAGFIQTLPDAIIEDIKIYGIRNSHLLTVAPTGTTGTMVGVSTGLEPHFGFSFYRSGRLGNKIKVNMKIVDEYLAFHPEYEINSLPDTFITAMDLTPEQHVQVQCTIQRWVDSSISKTVNAPKGYQVAQVAKIYWQLYQGGAKGGTVYVDGCRDNQVLSLN